MTDECDRAVCGIRQWHRHIACIACQRPGGVAMAVGDFFLCRDCRASGVRPCRSCRGRGVATVDAPLCSGCRERGQHLCVACGTVAGARVCPICAHDLGPVLAAALGSDRVHVLRLRGGRVVYARGIARHGWAWISADVDGAREQVRFADVVSASPCLEGLS